MEDLMCLVNQGQFSLHLISKQSLPAKLHALLLSCVNPLNLPLRSKIILVDLLELRDTSCLFNFTGGKVL